jgi:acetoin utilization deacetylase AcuC-like enzyme
VEHPSTAEADLSAYECVHDAKLLDFLSTAWDRWVELGEDGRDSDACSYHTKDADATSTDDDKKKIPGLIPINFALHRNSRERPGNSVYGGIAYYCTDMCTPIVAPLLEELRWDGAVVKLAVKRAVAGSRQIEEEPDGTKPISAAYAITTHPGHHAAKDSFGGYCYVNHAARAAREMQKMLGDDSRVAILDVDYHCGNGTAAIFYTDASVWVASIHCDPNFDYPFTAGFSDQIGEAEGWGSTMHMPLPPGTSWEKEYEETLSVAVDAIATGFGAQGFIISLGIDTYDGDAVPIRRAGFHLSGNDYKKMGALIGSKIPKGVATVFIQEGGYKMDVVGDAAADVVASFCRAQMNREAT